MMARNIHYYIFLVYYISFCIWYVTIIMANHLYLGHYIYTVLVTSLM